MQGLYMVALNFLPLAPMFAELNWSFLNGLLEKRGGIF